MGSGGVPCHILIKRGVHMNCPVCGMYWFDSGESYMLFHIIKEHFVRTRGKFIGEFPNSNKVMTRYFHYQLECWCGWDAFWQLGNAVNLPKDFEVAKVACVLHLERDGGAASHWLNWRLNNMDLELPPHLTSKERVVKFTAEGGFL
jgi:hypothetical protein